MNIQHDTSEGNIGGAEHSSPSVFIHINDRLGATSSLFPKPTIFKVHTMLRRENQMAYEPNIVAIGPYHRGKDRLQVMEDRKLRWFKSILEQGGESDATKYVEAMKRLEPKARQCYSESTVNIKEDEFVEMLLLDSCFIIQFLRWYLHRNTCRDTFFRLDLFRICLMRDMLLFENQIPLFVVQELFSMIKLPQEPTHFHDLALEFLTEWSWDRIDIPIDTMRSQLTLNHDNDIPHILGLMHYILHSLTVNDSAHHLPTKAKWTLPLWETKGFKFISNQLHRWFDQKNRNNNHDRPKSESIPSAIKLHAAGVQFMEKKVESNPFEITFKDGVMEIPIFKIDDGTERLYRNLIAYEQYNQEDINCVGLYAKLMDCLIDSTEDVALLRSFGIIRSYLGEDEAISNMFNKLTNEIILPHDMTGLFEKVNAYYGKRRHRWMATLRSDYFNSPWALISFLAAVFLILLTLTQTVFSILGGV